MFYALAFCLLAFSDKPALPAGPVINQVKITYQSDLQRTLIHFAPIKTSTYAAGPVFARIWWDFNGTTILDTFIPESFSPDDNNIPDCSPNLGLYWCEIRAYPAYGYYDPIIPDLQTIDAIRWKN